MTSPQRINETRTSSQAATQALVLQELRTGDLSQITTLIKDFFLWFEKEWGQPVVHPTLAPPPYKPLDQFTFRTLPPDGRYTFAHLASLWGHTLLTVKSELHRRKIQHVGQIFTSQGVFSVFQGRDLAQVVEVWEWRRLLGIVDDLWARFTHPPCGICANCRRGRATNLPIYCRKYNNLLKQYRTSFTQLLEGVRAYGSVAAWWRHEQKAIFDQTSTVYGQMRGLIFLYLLDRHFIELSINDLLRLPFTGLMYSDMLRPWRNRRPEEYASFQQGLAYSGFNGENQEMTLALLITLVLLRYGFPGLAELGRRLSPMEIEQAIDEGRLVTQHLTFDVYLPFSLIDDVCVGHVVFDEIRYYFWSYAAHQVPPNLHGLGPRGWRISHVQTIEWILTTKRWRDGHSLLPRRPEVEQKRVNPFYVQKAAERNRQAIKSLPQLLQDCLYAHIRYRYQEKHLALNSIKYEVRVVIEFFTFALAQPDLGEYLSWDRKTMAGLGKKFLAKRYAQVADQTVYEKAIALYTFFQTIAKLDLPHPLGYSALANLVPRVESPDRPLPSGDILDRIYREGVCKLDYDPFSRLALTIQFYCGTRVQETCDLPLICIVENPVTKDAWLLIPRGKTKEERSFPIVASGMGHLLEYMDQIVALQLSPDGKARHEARMNLNYLEVDREKASEWNYLFDRKLHSPHRSGVKRQVLTSQRVEHAFGEALILAAKGNPRGLFQEGTYSPQCHQYRRIGQRCWYFAVQDGVMICPICQGDLPGKRGHHCNRRLSQEFHCGGVAVQGEYFCPKCDAPLAELIDLTPHIFRHNSVTRAHRHGVSLEQNMSLHGHKSVPMHLRYLHIFPKEVQDEVRRVFAEMQVEVEVLANGFTPGQIIQDGVGKTLTLVQYLGYTLSRSLRRRTYGLWGGFWAGALANQGTMSPMGNKSEMIITEDTYEYMVAQFRYEALGLAVSEVALERATKGKFRARVAPFLDHQEIDRLVTTHLEHVQQYIRSPLGLRLMEKETEEQRLFLDQLADMLRPWWEDLGSVDELVLRLLPEELDVFHKPGPSSESAS